VIPASQAADRSSRTATGPPSISPRAVLVQLTEQARFATREVYGPLADAMTEFERYSDGELELIRNFLRRGSDVLVEQAARVQDPTRRRSRGSSG
jgi:hypothetical protein